MASIVSTATLQSLGSRVLSPARPAKVACRQATTPAIGWAAAPPRPDASRLVALSPKQHLHSAAASAASARAVTADDANAVGLPRSPGAMVDQAAAAVQVNQGMLALTMHACCPPSAGSTVLSKLTSSLLLRELTIPHFHPLSAGGAGRRHAAADCCVPAAYQRKGGRFHSD